MESLQTSLHSLLVLLTRLFEPLMNGVGEVDTFIDQELLSVGVPTPWRSIIIVALWAVLLVLLVRSVTGWLRALMLIFLAIVLARVYGLIPPY